MTNSIIESKTPPSPSSRTKPDELHHSSRDSMECIHSVDANVGSELVHSSEDILTQRQQTKNGAHSHFPGLQNRCIYVYVETYRYRYGSFLFFNYDSYSPNNGCKTSLSSHCLKPPRRRQEVVRATRPPGQGGPGQAPPPLRVQSL